MPNQPQPPQPPRPAPPPPQQPPPPKPPEDPRSAKAATITQPSTTGPVPPRWDDPSKIRTMPPQPEWNVEPAIDPRAEKPPQGWTGDGMTIADEQRARSAWIEAHGMAAYEKETDPRKDEDKPVIDPHALAGGAAYVSQGAGHNKQVPGVTPPTKRS